MVWILTTVRMPHLCFLNPAPPSPTHLLNESLRVKASFIEHFSWKCFPFQSIVKRSSSINASDSKNLTWLLPGFFKPVDLNLLQETMVWSLEVLELLFSPFNRSLPWTCSYTQSNSHHEIWIVEIGMEFNHSVLRNEKTEGQPPAQHGIAGSLKLTEPDLGDLTVNSVPSNMRGL